MRTFVVVAGVEEELDRAALAAALPGEVTVILTGVPHAEPRAPTVWELAGAVWVLADPLGLAA